MASPDQSDEDVLSELLEGFSSTTPDQESLQEAGASVNSETSAGEQTGKTSEVVEPPIPVEKNSNILIIQTGFEGSSVSFLPPGCGLLVPCADSKKGTRSSRRKSKPKKLIIPEEQDGETHVDDLKEDGEDLIFSPTESEMAPSTDAETVDGSQSSGTTHVDGAAPFRSRKARKRKPMENFRKPYLTWNSGDAPSLMFVVPSEEMAAAANAKKKKKPPEEESQEMHWCDICDDCFPSLNDLEMHQVTHVDEPKEDFDCEECGRVFDTISELEEHLTKRHGKLRYRCDICGIQYNYKSQFAIHMRAHSAEKQFTCDECGKDFKHRCSLVIHQRKHAGVTPHQCRRCSKMLDTRSELLKHEKLRHCPDCNKCYTARGYPKHLLKKTCVKP